MVKRSIFILIISFLFCQYSFSQINQGLWFSDSLFQKQWVNPAHKFGGKFTINLPNAYFEILQKGPKYDDVIGVNNEGITTVDITATLENAESKNWYSTLLNVGSLGFGINLGRSSFSIQHSVRVLGNLKLSKDFFEVYANGNAPYIGQTVAIGPDFQVSVFHELALGYAYGTEQFRIGGRIKILSGIKDASVEEDRINMRTSDDIYQLEFDNNYLINTSTLLEIEDLSNIAVDFEDIDYYNLFSPNRGFSFDLGAEYKLTSGATIGASLLDIGSIKWTENVTNYLSSGQIIYDGIDIVDVIRDTIDILLVDSLSNVLEFQESNNDYKTGLPFKFAVQYSQNRQSSKFSWSCLYMMQKFRGHTQHNLIANTNFHWAQANIIGLNVSLNSDTLFNVGLHGIIKWGPFQMYGSIANIITVVNPKSSKHTSASLGFNLAF